MSEKDAAAAVRATLRGSTREDRASLAAAVLREIYDHVKFRINDDDEERDVEMRTFGGLLNVAQNHETDLLVARAKRPAPPPPSLVQRVVDRMAERAAAECPEVEFTVFVAPELADLIPVESSRLRRDGGYYHGHVYRDMLVEQLAPAGSLEVILVPLTDGSTAAANASTYVGNVATGEVSAR